MKKTQARGGTSEMRAGLQSSASKREVITPVFVWLAFTPCGCLVGACKYPDDHQTDAKLLAWLHDGLTVRRVTFDDWRATYLAVFLQDCPHEEPASTHAVDPQ
jgi:hypothetical protein